MAFMIIIIIVNPASPAEPATIIELLVFPPVERMTLVYTQVATPALAKKATIKFMLLYYH